MGVLAHVVSPQDLIAKIASVLKPGGTLILECTNGYHLLDRVNQLRNHLRKSLSDHMIPSSFVFMDCIPLGGNGKVDRKLLPLPDPVRPKLDTEYQEPRDELELAMAQIWSDLLGLAPIGVHDHFRDLGGDSLLAVQVVSRIWDRFDLELSEESLFDRPTIAELAAYIRSNSANTLRPGNGNEAPAREFLSAAVPQTEVIQEEAVSAGIHDSYKVVVNLEEQYSILRAALPVPRGWREAAIYGSKRECLDQIARVWTDMRPLSIRKQSQLK